MVFMTTCMIDQTPATTLEPRLRTALRFGYMDAKHMVFLKETFGLPLDFYVDRLRKDFPLAKIDYRGLEHELLMRGAKESAVAAQLEELRSVDRDWKVRI